MTATPEREQLSKLLFFADNNAASDEHNQIEFDAQHVLYGESTYTYQMADAVLAAGYRRPRTITTVEELDALAVGSVVIDGHGDVCERFGNGWAGIIKERLMDTWLLAGAEDVPLDATVLLEGATK